MEAAPPAMQNSRLQVRREMATRDAANIRQFEHWQTDGPSMQLDRPDVNGQPVFLDMNPTNSRSLDSKNYFQNQTYIAGKDSFTQNPYYRDYAPAYDPRNAVREVRSAVFEDRFDRGLRESKQLLARSFTTAWLPEDYVQKNNLDTLKSLVAYEDLKPRMDNVERQYRKAPPSSK